MSTFPNSPNTALVVIDMQVGVLASAWRREETIENVTQLVAKAREGGAPVVWVRHRDKELIINSPAWQIVPGLQPTTGEAIVEKHHADSFEDTDLTETLTRLHVSKLVICGAQSDACVLSTLFGAFVRGYDVTLVSDAHTTEDRTPYGGLTPEQSTAFVNLMWQYRTAPGRKAVVATTDTTTF